MDTLVARLAEEGIAYTDATPTRFPRSTLHAILRDRAYIGEIRNKGQWLKGKQAPLVDRVTWDRVQAILGDNVYRAHEMTYASELIECGHCGRPITGETKYKRTRDGVRAYIYYRCCQYNRSGHPRVRLTEPQLDDQVVRLFNRLRVEDAEVRSWFADVLRARTRDEQRESLTHLEAIEPSADPGASAAGPAVELAPAGRNHSGDVRGQRHRVTGSHDEPATPG